MIWLLLVLYQIKHFVCDYPLQGKYMLGKFKDGNAWILPLLAHAAVHGLATFLIALMFKPELAVWLGLLDMGLHFAVDRVKASPNLLGRFKPLNATEYKALLAERARISEIAPDGHREIDAIDAKFKANTYFWWSLGADQSAHHLTHYLIIWLLV